MQVHILGIGGTFMSGIALLAKACGHQVTGSDHALYPPMSTQLAAAGIAVAISDAPDVIPATVDAVIVGNVISRGHPALEYVLNHRIPYWSGPGSLREFILKDRTVLAVAGTHGKTTTTSLLAWILELADLNPGFLIGGIAENFQVSARLGSAPYFIVEADEYDTAFFDKRAKFLHYYPQILILNNLEYDHADIYPDLAAIQQQFHYLVRMLPSAGMIVQNANDQNLAQVLARGCWSGVVTFGGAHADWQARLLQSDGGAFEVYYQHELYGVIEWDLLGAHNVANALAALAAATPAGVAPAAAVAALRTFKSVKRRLELKGTVRDITIYDDFAHHPTAIATTLAGLRAKVGRGARIVVVIEFGSYTMRSGVHKARLAAALTDADWVVCKNTVLDWGLVDVLADCAQPTALHNTVDELIDDLAKNLRPRDHVVVMSNTGFDGLHDRLLAALEAEIAR